MGGEVDLDGGSVEELADALKGFEGVEVAALGGVDAAVPVGAVGGVVAGGPGVVGVVLDDAEAKPGEDDAFDEEAFGGVGGVEAEAASQVADVGEIDRSGGGFDAEFVDQRVDELGVEGGVELRDDVGVGFGEGL